MLNKITFMKNKFQNSHISVEFYLYRQLYKLYNKLNIFYSICLHREFNIYKFLIAIFMVIISIDGFETWLKYKHRETFLRRISACNESIDSSMQLYQYMLRVKIWINKKWSEFLFLRETNHTKVSNFFTVLLSLLIIGTLGTGTIRDTLYNEV